MSDTSGCTPQLLFMPLPYTHTPPGPVSRRASVSSHMAFTEPWRGLTTLIHRAAELCGIPVHSERLSFLTLRYGIRTLATACGDRLELSHRFPS